MSSTKVTFDFENFAMATIDGETIAIESYEVDESGEVTQFTLADGRRFEASWVGFVDMGKGAV